MGALLVMNKFLVYLKLELKRILKLFPMICMVTFVVLAAAGFFFINQDEDKGHLFMIHRIEPMDFDD